MNFVTVSLPHRTLRLGSRLVSTALVLTLSATGLSGSNPPAASAAPAVNATQKPFTLFMGADFSVMWADQLRPVEDVQGRAFVVFVDGNSVLVPSRLTDLQIKVDSALKLTTSSASILKLEAERGYTRGSDPADRIGEAMALSQLADAAVDVADQTLRANESIQGYQAASSGAPVPDLTARAEGQAIQAASMAQNSIVNSIAESTVRAGAQGMQEQFDAVRLSFVVSSPKSLAKPYAVVVIRYRIEPERPESSRVWVYAMALSRVDAVPRRVSLARGGFSPGYQLEDVQIHVYDQGGEIATNLSPKRVELTTDEAFQYSVIDYISQNRGKTLDLAPARAYWPEDIRVRLAGEKPDQRVYLKIGKDGRPAGAFENDACTKKIADAALSAVLAELRFNPALNKGKPVESIAAMNLGRLFE